jgi:hypothetical protein
MRELGLARMTGQGNSTSKQQFKQVATTDVQAVRFWAFMAVGANAVVSVLTNDDSTSALGYWTSATKTAYQNVLYTGQFAAIKLTSGTVVLYLSEQ